MTTCVQYAHQEDDARWSAFMRTRTLCSQFSGIAWQQSRRNSGTGNGEGAIAPVLYTFGL